jgi:hypothetical protein
VDASARPRGGYEGGRGGGRLRWERAGPRGRACVRADARAHPRGHISLFVRARSLLSVRMVKTRPRVKTRLLDKHGRVRMSG